MSTNKIIALGCFTGTLQDWCDALGLKKATVSGRMLRGFTPYEALYTPVGSRIRAVQPDG